MSSQDKAEQKKLETCPHCGHKLSPWQQVLLNVDRALTCKNCWYRIILDVFEIDKPAKEDLNKDKDQ
jgi:DNA-directed RNA polymerase subunit RPC12/RpoP